MLLLRLFAALGLVTVALLNLGGAHRYKSPEYRQRFSVKEVEDDDFTREEADGYEECEEFNENFDESASNEIGNAANGQHHFLKRHKPKPVEQICSKYECPIYEKVESSGCGFETRIILRANWIVTDVDLSAPEGFREAYIRLHRYRSGLSNDRGQKMAFVVPVVETSVLDQNSTVLRASMRFYIPAEFQSDPPASTNKQVRVQEWNAAKVYSRAYGGYREDQEYLKQYDLLKTALEKENITPHPYIRMTAGFTHHGFGRQRLEAILVDYDSWSMELLYLGNGRLVPMSK